MQCPKCQDPNARLVNTKYGQRIRCDACDSWSNVQYGEQNNNAAPYRKKAYPQKQSQEPKKNDKQIGRLACIKAVCDTLSISLENLENNNTSIAEHIIIMADKLFDYSENGLPRYVMGEDNQDSGEIEL